MGELWKVLMVMFFVGTFAVMAIGIGKDFERAAVMETVERVPVPKVLSDFWPECRSGIGVTWREVDTKRAQRWSIFPCEDRWWYRYEEYQGTGTLWYATKIREFWYDAPPEMHRPFRRLLLSANSLEPWDATPTPATPDGTVYDPRPAAPRRTP
jgi:hypothetical protein